MKDRLEKFIDDHRGELDPYDPQEGGWQKIETRMKQKKEVATIKKLRILPAVLSTWKIAAAFVLLIAATIVFIRYEKNTIPAGTQATAPEYGSIDAQYVALIEVKRGELKKLEKENPELYHEFWNETEILEKDYRELKMQMKSSPNSEIILQAMLRNLQMQIDILNRQLTIIQQLKRLKNESATKSI